MVRRRSLPRSSRLRRTEDIRAMFREGRRRRCGPLDWYVRPSPAARGPRVGVVVPRHGRTIVERNLLRRRLREILRTTWLPGERERSKPRDLLVRAGRGAYGLDFDALLASLRAGPMKMNPGNGERTGPAAADAGA